MCLDISFLNIGVKLHQTFQNITICECFYLQGQILAVLKALDSDWFAQNYMGRKAKVGAFSKIRYSYNLLSGTLHPPDISSN